MCSGSIIWSIKLNRDFSHSAFKFSRIQAIIKISQNMHFFSIIHIYSVYVINYHHNVLAIIPATYSKISWFTSLFGGRISLQKYAWFYSVPANNSRYTSNHVRRSSSSIASSREINEQANNFIYVCNWRLYEKESAYLLLYLSNI